MFKIKTKSSKGEEPKKDSNDPKSKAKPSGDPKPKEGGNKPPPFQKGAPSGGQGVPPPPPDPMVGMEMEGPPPVDPGMMGGMDPNMAPPPEPGMGEGGEPGGLPMLPMAQVRYLSGDQGPFACGNCCYFVGPESCEFVDGVIDPAGICTLFCPQNHGAQAMDMDTAPPNLPESMDSGSSPAAGMEMEDPLNGPGMA